MPAQMRVDTTTTTEYSLRPTPVAHLKTPRRAGSMRLTGVTMWRWHSETHLEPYERSVFVYPFTALPIHSCCRTVLALLLRGMRDKAAARQTEGAPETGRQREVPKCSHVSGNSRCKTVAKLHVVSGEWWYCSCTAWQEDVTECLVCTEGHLTD
jgi:hypothetical protein